MLVSEGGRRHSPDGHLSLKRRLGRSLWGAWNAVCYEKGTRRSPRPNWPPTGNRRRPIQKIGSFSLRFWQERPGPEGLTSLGWNLVLLAGLLVVSSVVLAVHAPSAETVTLPIRVYAPDGASSHVETIPLQVADASSVDSLYVRAHQPFYHRGGDEQGQHEGFDVEGAASVRINGGAWVDVTNETVGCPRPERIHAQCIGGAFSTVRFTLPAENVQDGTNQIHFRFNGTQGIRSGYRVLAVGVMRPSDPHAGTFDPQTDGAHDGTLLEYEDPSTWGPPDGYGSVDDVQSGQEWFNTARLLDGPGGTEIRASCSDCHAQDGRDLAYFNYSNRTIVARSRFHGLSAEKGRQIAAYIRSIELKKRSGATYEAPGTPWDPPYQPGPELKATGEGPDASNQVYWAAGAGLDGVLERDRAMLPYLFPDGNGGVDYYETPNGNRALRWKHVHMDSTLNMRALPLSIQFPDWNSWLPDVHPKDAFPTQWDNSATRSTYQDELQNALDNYGGGFDEKELRSIQNELEGLHINFAAELKDASNEENLSENLFTLAHLSGQQWLAVKVWESMHGHHLEDVADEMYGGAPMQPYREPRSWIGRKRTLFNIGPHIALPNGIGGGPPYQYGSEYMDQLMSHVWYQLQVSVNPGARPGSSTQSPVDWNYHNSFLKAAPQAGLRNIASHIKASQLLSNGYGVDGSGGDGYHRAGFRRGWEPFTVKPGRFMKLRGHYRYSNLSAELREDLYTATLRAWNDFNMRFPVEEHPRASGGSRYNPSDYVPSAWGYTNPRWHAQKIYQGLYETGDQFPEAFGAMDTLATWGSRMWPETEGPAWKDLVDYFPPGDGAPPSLTLEKEGDEPAVWGPDVTVSADVTDPDGPVKIVEFFLGDKPLDEDTEPPYEHRLTDLPYNIYRINARVRDDQNLVSRDTITFAVGPDDPPDPSEQGLYYAYLESDWERNEVPDFSVLRPLRGGEADRFDLSALNPRDDDFSARFFGYIDIPESGTYTFYTHSSDGSVLRIDGSVVVDNDGRHAGEEQSGTVELSAGRHSIALGYFVQGGQPRLKVSWAGPGMDKTEVPRSRLYHTDSVDPPSIEMGGLRGTRMKGTGVRLTWTTTSETKNEGFAVQRRMSKAERPGAVWTRVGFIESKAAEGTTQEPKSYQFTDESPPFEADSLRYRLRQVGQDESVRYSDVVTVERAVPRLKLLGTYPNPAQSHATVRFAVPDRRDVTLTMYDVLGRQVRTLHAGDVEGRRKETIDLSGIASGVYFLRLTVEGGAARDVRTQRLTIVR